MVCFVWGVIVGVVGFEQRGGFRGREA